MPYQRLSNINGVQSVPDLLQLLQVGGLFVFGDELVPDFMVSVLLLHQSHDFFPFPSDVIVHVGYEPYHPIVLLKHP